MSFNKKFLTRPLFILLISIALFSFSNAVLKPVDKDDAVTFVIKNFGINTNGSFKGLEGTINYDVANISNTSFDITIDVATVNTGNDMRDAHLKKEEYFDEAKYPHIHFKSTTVTTDNVTGSLTIKGVTKVISFPYTVSNSSGSYIFSSSFTIDRRDYNVGGGSMVLGDNVIVNLKVEAK